MVSIEKYVRDEQPQSAKGAGAPRRAGLSVSVAAGALLLQRIKQ